ncbi:hypothetical protein ACFL0I_02570 [Gemmatimonadota bacterium]
MPEQSQQGSLPEEETLLQAFAGITRAPLDALLLLGRKYPVPVVTVVLVNLGLVTAALGVHLGLGLALLAGPLFLLLFAVVFLLGPPLIAAAFQMLAGLLVIAGAFIGFATSESFEGALIGGGLGLLVAGVFWLVLVAPFLLPGAALGYLVFLVFGSSDLGVILGLITGLIVTGIVFGLLKAVGPYFFLLFWAWVSAGLAERFCLLLIGGYEVSELFGTDMRLSGDLMRMVERLFETVFAMVVPNPFLGAWAVVAGIAFLILSVWYRQSGRWETQ